MKIEGEPCRGGPPPILRPFQLPENDGKMARVCQADAGPALLPAKGHVSIIPSDSHLSIDQDGPRHILLRLPYASMRRDWFALHLIFPTRIG
jgi:hypothetical protein